jgi:hypothetical protein
MPPQASVKSEWGPGMRAFFFNGSGTGSEGRAARRSTLHGLAPSG